MVIDAGQRLGGGPVGEQEAADDVHLPELHRAAAPPAFPDLLPAVPLVRLDDAGAHQTAVDR
jgi:hypothetical protein